LYGDYVRASEMGSQKKASKEKGERNRIKKEGKKSPRKSGKRMGVIVPNWKGPKGVMTGGGKKKKKKEHSQVREENNHLGKKKRGRQPIHVFVTRTGRRKSRRGEVVGGKSQ